MAENLHLLREINGNSMPLYAYVVIWLMKMLHISSISSMYWYIMCHREMVDGKFVCSLNEFMSVRNDLGLFNYMKGTTIDINLI